MSPHGHTSRKWLDSRFWVDRASRAGVWGLCVHVCCSAHLRGTCALGFVSKNKNHGGILRPSGSMFSSFFFFPAWLQMCRGSESPLLMTSFPLFLNEALACQEGAYSAGLWAEGHGRGCRLRGWPRRPGLRGPQTCRLCPWEGGLLVLGCPS